MMVSKAEVQDSRGDIVKYALALLIVAGAVCCVFISMRKSLLLFRVLGMLLAFGVAAAVLYQTDSGRKLWVFFQAARTEVRKVVWPTRAETMQTTLIVFVLVLLVGLFLWLLDTMLGAGFQFVTGIGRG